MTSRRKGDRAAIDRLIAKRVGRGFSDSEIAAEVSLVPRSVSRRRLPLGIRRPAPKTTWTLAEDAELKCLFNVGLSDAQISRRLKRTAPTAIQGRRSALRLIRLVERNWTPEDDALFTSLWGSALTVRQIAEILSRTLQAATKRRRTLGLPPRS